MQSLHNIKPDLWPVEKFAAYLSVAFLTFNLVEIVRRNISVDWAGYGILVGTIVFTLAIGQYYRISGKSARIGAALTTTGLMLLLSMNFSVLNYVLLPTAHAPIDQLLVQMDDMVGFHWPDAIALVVDYPVLNTILKYAYLSTMPQLAVLLIVLGLSGRIHDLHVLLAFIAITATILITFWYFFPSFGTTVIYSLDANLERTFRPVVGSAYGKELISLSQNGPQLISPKEVKGLIAFPSYHATLAFIAMYCARNVRWLFPVYLIVNLLILPATVLHGGHHLVDIPAGLCLFLLGAWLAERAVDSQHSTEQYPTYLQPELNR